MKPRKLLPLIFLSFCVSTCFSQGLWEDLNFPASEYSDLTCIAFDGDGIYAGTRSSGVVFSSNKGVEWKSTNSSIGTETVKNIIVGIDNIVWVHTGNSGLFWTNHRGEDWNSISWFTRRGKIISCMAIDQYGHVFIGANDGVYRSVDLGNSWVNISPNLVISNVYAIGIRGSELYASLSEEKTGFYLSDVDGTSWIEINEGLPESPITNKFVFSPRGSVYAIVSGKIYFTTNQGKSWLNLKNDLDNIADLIIDSRDNLITYDHERIRIYSGKDRKWIPDRDDLEMKDLLQIQLDDDYLWIIKGKKLEKANKKIEIIIAEFITFWHITVLDDNDNPIKNKIFNIYKTWGSNQQGMGTKITNENGIISINSGEYKEGDGIKLERIVFTQPSAKANHQDVNNTMYRIKVDNGKFDTAGSCSYDIIPSNTSFNIKVNHTTVMFSLLFGVEWDAKPEYLDSLSQWLKQMNNFLYDIFDGQLYLERVAIYDNQKYWKDVDIHIWASNMVWPTAFLDGIYVLNGKKTHLPRKWFGNRKASIDYSTKDYWLTFAGDYFWTTISHELGHYMLGFDDEYQFTDTVKAKLLPSYYNYGFMCDQYPNSGPWHSELSNTKRYPSDNYKITYQVYTNKTDCWNDFETIFEKTYDGIKCPIIKPSERNNLSGRDYFVGPNDETHPSLTCDVSYYIDCQQFDQNIGAGNFTGICKKTENNKSSILPYTDLFLLKSNGYIYQGRTDDSARCVVLGANVGDYIFATYNDQMNFSTYIAKYPVNNVSNNKLQMNEKVQEFPDIMLEKLDASYPFINYLGFDNDGKPFFMSYSEKEHSNEIKLEYPNTETEKRVTALTYNTSSKSYKTVFDNGIFESGYIKFNTMDQDSKEFVTFMPYEIIDPEQRITTSDGSMIINFGEGWNNIRNFALCSSNTLVPLNGLPQNSLHIGMSYSVSSFPTTELTGQKTLTIFYSIFEMSGYSENNIKICKWNFQKNKWDILQSYIDTSRKFVRTEFYGFGVYTLFAINDETGIHYQDQGSINFDLAPNPSQGTLEITFKNWKPAELNISISDILGNEIFNELALISGQEDRIIIIMESVPNGTYLLKISSEGRAKTMSFIINK